ncbi:MAG TPA: hypothetical protein VGI66_18605, partial [Streptosporangiaceae bacterium]
MSPVIRPASARWPAAVVAAVCLAWLLSATPGAAAAARGAAGAPTAAHAAAILSPPVGTGASDVTNLGSNGWEVQSSAVATQSGAQISTPGFGTSTWLPVANDDAGAPGTEIEALLQNGQCPGDTALQPVNQSTSSPNSVFFSDNLKLCYGSASKIGAVSVKEFSAPWWWRTDFTAALQAGQVASLIVNGVVGSANIWVNGTEVATSSTVTGDYTRFTFTISSIVLAGTNSLAIEVNPNNPASMFTLDNVDWTQIPPDNNTGIQFPVQLRSGGPLSVGNAHVVQNTAADLSSSALTIKVDVTNTSTSSQTGTVQATVTGQAAQSASVTVAANSTKTVTFSKTIASPKIWWPYQLGAQPMYTLDTSVAQNGT